MEVPTFFYSHIEHSADKLIVVPDRKIACLFCIVHS